MRKAAPLSHKTALRPVRLGRLPIHARLLSHLQDSCEATNSSGIHQPQSMMLRSSCFW